MVENKPKIRFKKFDKAWEKIKLGNYASYRRGSFPQPYGKKEWYGGKGAFPFVQVYDVGDNLKLLNETKSKISEKAQPLSVKAYKGQVLVTLQGTIGRVAIMQYDAFVDRTVLIFEGYKEKTDVFYWANVIKLKFEKEAQQAPGVTIKTITEKALSEFELYKPKYEEQQQIGFYLKNLNELIEKENRKLVKYKKIRESLLRKMFPQEDSNVPEIRFKGFKGEWRKEKLYKLTIWDKQFNEVEKFKQPKAIKYPYVLADELISLEDPKGDVLLLSTGTYKGYTTILKAGENLCKGEIVAIPWGGTANVKYCNGYFVTADNRIATSNDTEKLLNKFLYYIFNNKLAYIQNTYRGASIQHPNMSEILDMEILLPDIKEQKAICDYFDKIEILIEKQKEKINNLENIKTTLLSKMFV